jgi:hypothetical protein|tara:strand:- start:312 stop:608 length:297 start_codon:yes stop_codon:yes gene_type:complete
MAKKKQKNCSQCKEKIVLGMELVMNNRTICLGCAVEKGIAQQWQAPIRHVLYCEYDIHSCAECYMNYTEMMEHLGYVCTPKGTFYKPTDDPKIVVLYE